MRKFVYPVLFGASYLGTRFVGLERTVAGFQKAGRQLRRFGLGGKRSSDEVVKDLASSYDVLPLSIRCLDQAVVTWSLLNLHGHPARMKIGVMLAPFCSHAWVELDKEVFVDFLYRPDMQVISQFEAWN